MDKVTGRLTTHVLDTARGRPAAGMAISLARGAVVLVETATNADGRTDAALVPEGALQAGEYELRFDVGAYFGEGLYGIVPIRIRIDDPSRSYHVPLLASPWSYSTYRGS